MSLTAKKYKATGKAKCILCRKPLLKGQKAILISGFRTEGQIHCEPSECDR